MDSTSFIAPVSNEQPAQPEVESPAIDTPNNSSPEAEQESEKPNVELAAPNLSDMPLHEWIAALTHPATGQYPNGITTRMMDSLVKQMGVCQFPSPDRRRFHNVWKTVGHFAVFLSEAARKGRIRRISLGTYKGIFSDQDVNKPMAVIELLGTDKKTLDPLNALLHTLGAFCTHLRLVRSMCRVITDDESRAHQLSDLSPLSLTIPNGNLARFASKPALAGSSSKRKSFYPQRYPTAFEYTKRVCVTSPSANVVPAEPGPQTESPKRGNERPPSCDSMNGGSGSSTDGCPVQKRPKVVIRRKGRKMEIVQIPGDPPALPIGSQIDEIGQFTKIREPGIVSSVTSMGSEPKKPLTITGPIRNGRASSGYTRANCHNGDIDEFGLPSLCKVDPDLETATIESMGALSSDDVGRLCEKFGFEEEVTAALTREQIDGTALLLMTREDITHNLGLKLGPALKLHRLVRTLQFYAKRSQ